MRATFLAVLMDANGPATLESAVDLADTSLRMQGYAQWSHPIPEHYQKGPREFLCVDISTRHSFALFCPTPTNKAAHWALELSRAPLARAVVLYMGPELDQVPGVGSVFRGGPGDEALLKIYADHEPWLKIGAAEDTEVAYPIPPIVMERRSTVMAKLEPFLGALATPLDQALIQALERGAPTPGPLLAALGLSESLPTPQQSLRLLHRDSPLFRKASPPPIGRGIK